MQYPEKWTQELFDELEAEGTYWSNHKPHGEKMDDIKKQIEPWLEAIRKDAKARAEKMNVKRYTYQPGNGTRYDLIYGKVPASVYGTTDKLVEAQGEHTQTMLTWMKSGGSGGGTIVFDLAPCSGYLAEKMNIGTGDAVALIRFLHEQGEAVYLEE